MNSAGLSNRRIATNFRVTYSVISRLLARYKHRGTVKDRPRSGRPRTTTPREDRYLNRRARLQLLSTAVQLRGMWPIDGRIGVKLLFADCIVFDCVFVDQ